MTATSSTGIAIKGDGLELRPWDEDLVAQMASWGERGFPYAAFDLTYLRDPKRAKATLAWTREPDQHLHFVACEGETAVGRLSVNLDDTAGLYLWAVHVPPEHEGRGVARRMITALMPWLFENYPGKDLVLTTNTFADPAHAAYRSVGFEVTETRWQTDLSISSALWKLPVEERGPVNGHVRFNNGRWEVRVYVMRLAAPGAVSPAQ